jgi:hypothetical protein
MVAASSSSWLSYRRRYRQKRQRIDALPAIERDQPLAQVSASPSAASDQNRSSMISKNGCARSAENSRPRTPWPKRSITA